MDFLGQIVGRSQDLGEGRRGSGDEVLQCVVFGELRELAFAEAVSAGISDVGLQSAIPIRIVTDRALTG
jgi:hypothetical protein